MTPTKVLALSDAVGSLILDHLRHVHDVRAITNEDGHLLVPPPEQPSNWRLSHGLEEEDGSPLLQR
jgi:hypothetical protein